MKDLKTPLLVLLSILLCISIGLLITAFFHFYYKSPSVEYRPVMELTSKDKIIISTGSQDSMQQIYTETLQRLDKHLDSTWATVDSINNTLDLKISDFYKLRGEITAILKDRSPNADLAAARQKIAELQYKVTALRFINKDVEKENDRLTAMLEELRAAGKGSGTRTLNNDDKNPGEKSNGTAIFLITDIKLSAIKTGNDKEEETFIAGDAEKFAGSCVIRSNSFSGNADIMIVLVKPDGKILQNSADNVMFETAQGRKIYSGKVNIDYQKGELKRLPFTIPAAGLQQGNYTLEIYYNGKLAGRLIKALL